MLQSNEAETIPHLRSLTFGTAALPWRCHMQSKIIGTELPSRHFQPRIYGVGAWTDHLDFGYDLVALLQPKLVVELGVDRGESYFAFCQSAVENQTSTRCFGVVAEATTAAGVCAPSPAAISAPAIRSRLCITM